MGDAVQEGSERIPLHVMIRINPGSSGVEHTPAGLRIENAKNKMVSYAFDRCFGPEATTCEIYEDIRSAIRGSDGEVSTAGSTPATAPGTQQTHVSVIAYGQSGSGKTFTMSGSTEAPGIVPLVLKDLLEVGKVCISLMEIYNERIIDLLDGKEKQLRGTEGRLVVRSLTINEVSTLEEFDALFAAARHSRKTGETQLNKHSSRSHLIIRAETATRTVDLVDLAGSENNRRTGNTGLRLEESSNINRSLFVFGQVVNAIASRRRRIPYRDSKLTRLLQDSVGGTGRCFLIATILCRADDTSEAVNTLNFASTSKSVTNRSQTRSRDCGSVFERLHCGQAAAKKGNAKAIRKAFQTQQRKNRQQLSRTPLNKEAVDGGAEALQWSGEEPRQAECPAETTKENARPVRGVEDEPGRSNAGGTANLRKYKASGSSFSRSGIEMTPVTKQKSYAFFLQQAGDFERAMDFRSALEVYRTMRKFCDNDFVTAKITSLQNATRKEKVKFSAFQVLEILNSGAFIEIKKLSGIGDRRAQSVVDFIAGGNFFESLADLRMIFSEKIVTCIMECVEDQ